MIGVWVKLIGQNVPIMTLNWSRLFLAFVFAAIFIAPFYRRTIFDFKSFDLKGSLRVGFLMATAFSLFSTAMSLAPVGNVVMITSLYAVVTPLLAWLVLREKPLRRILIAIPMAFFGLAVINPFDPQNLLGNVVSLIHPFVFSSFLVYTRKEEKTHDLASLFWFFLFAALFLSPFPFIYGLGNLAASWHYVLALGFLSTGLPYMLLTYGLQKVPAYRAAVTTLVVLPLSGIFFAWLILKEVVAPAIYVGGALMIAAGLLVLWKEKRHRHFLHF